MNLVSRAGRRLAVGIALACCAIVLPAAALAASTAGGTPGHRAAAMLPPAGSASAAAAQQRQLAVTTLSGFKVVLTATRSPGTGPGPAATVTAAGYRHTPRGWKLIAAKQIGKGERVVLVRDGSLQPHGDPAQARAQLRGSIRHDHGAPAVGPGDRLPGALHRALATVTAIVCRGW